jgi:insulin-like growth factor 2 mRNA-binding protein 1
MNQPLDAFHFDLLFSLNDVSSFNMERVITIKGTIDNMSRAEGMISAKLRQSYESDLQAMAVSIC